MKSEKVLNKLANRGSFQFRTRGMNCHVSAGPFHPGGRRLSGISGFAQRQTDPHRRRTPLCRLLTLQPGEYVAMDSTVQALSVWAASSIDPGPTSRSIKGLSSFRRQASLFADARAKFPELA